MTNDVPVLFLVFNRPSKTKQVFDAIRAVRPKRLYVAADGPRAQRPEEAELCRQVQVIIDSVDWDCQVTKLVRTENLGCGRAVSGAISWFFEHVESGIILEDDVLPTPSFFDYCATLLERYADDPRVMSISGTNFQPEPSETVPHYRFSRYVGIWGWATWRRAWQGYDFAMKRWHQPELRVQLRTEFARSQALFLEKIFDGMVTTGVDTWDYQWWFHVLMAGGVSTTPTQNLTVNLGFDSTGTHTHRVSDEIRNMPLQALPSPLVHPTTVSVDRKSDLRLAKKYYWSTDDGVVSRAKQVLKKLKSAMQGVFTG